MELNKTMAMEEMVNKMKQDIISLVKKNYIAFFVETDKILAI